MPCPADCSGCSEPCQGLGELPRSLPCLHPPCSHTSDFRAMALGKLLVLWNFGTAIPSGTQETLAHPCKPCVSARHTLAHPLTHFGTPLAHICRLMCLSVSFWHFGNFVTPLQAMRYRRSLPKPVGKGRGEGGTQGAQVCRVCAHTQIWHTRAYTHAHTLNNMYNSYM